MIRKVVSVICTVSLAFVLGACSASSVDNNSTETSSSSEAVEVPETEASISEASEPEITQTEEGPDVLVVVFSQTGHTMGIAQMIAEIEDADLYEIVPAVPYTEEDLNYNDSSSRATAEQNDPSVRPEIGSDPIDISGYSRIYVGYPIWWGQEPRIMDTFAESYDFADATVIPFCTSGSSGIGQSGTNLEAASGSGNWIEGMRFPADASEADVRAWIESILNPE